jgi:hypothetical protein
MILVHFGRSAFDEMSTPAGGGVLFRRYWPREGATI